MSNSYVIQIERNEDFEISVEADSQEEAEAIATKMLSESDNDGGEFSTSRCDTIVGIEIEG